MVLDRIFPPARGQGAQIWQPHGGLILRFQARGGLVGFENTDTLPFTIAPVEQALVSSTVNADMSAEFTVPGSEIWRVVSLMGTNQTTGGHNVQFRIGPNQTVFVLGEVVVREVFGVAAALHTNWEPPEPLYLWPGDTIFIVVSDPGAGDNKSARVLFQRYVIQVKEGPIT